MCDFTQGFKEPELVKHRPVLVITPSMIGRPDLVTIVGLSTREPIPARNYHYMIPKNSMPQIGKFQEKDTWVKADMIYTVGFHRLNLIQLGKKDPHTQKRQYFTQKLGREQMKQIYTCVLHGINLGSLTPHL
jgi:mRNA interferase MazF